MWNILQRENALNKNVHEHHVGEICRFISLTNSKIKADVAELTPGSFIQLRFEDLEKYPAQILKQVYSDLGLDFKEINDKKVNAYMAESNSFQKNSFHLEDNEKDLIMSELRDYMKEYSYS